MATKKQKREIAEAKRAQFVAQLKADGLAAQKKDREEWVRLDKEMLDEIREVIQRRERVRMTAAIARGTIDR